MNGLKELGQNYVLIVAVVCWVTAQLIKTILVLITEKRWNWERMIGSGGMPSAHSASVCGLTVAVGRTAGLSSPLFAIAFLFACVVMYDATGVRRAAGEQAKRLNKIMETNNWNLDAKTLKESLGHTPKEVVAGAILGIVLALLIPQ